MTSPSQVNAVAAIARVVALHHPILDGVCAECSWQPHSINGNAVFWPCDTIRALGEASSDGGCA